MSKGKVSRGRGGRRESVLLPKRISVRRASSILSNRRKKLDPFPSQISKFVFAYRDLFDKQNLEITGLYCDS